VLDHVILNVRDFDRSKRFYSAALAPLGGEVIVEFPQYCGFGKDGKPWFFVAEREDGSAGTHVAFTSPDRATVDAFHAAAIEAGGTDNGAPGPRSYHRSYYGAFVLDPDGNNIEAVCHRSE
jgi:catechol 2,3-dioxygenase-like lactoylglutathione lyase family enzyme